MTLRTQDGYPIGTLCVLDVVPRDVKPEDVTSLDDLAGVVLRYLEPLVGGADRTVVPTLSERVLQSWPLSSIWGTGLGFDQRSTH